MRAQLLLLMASLAFAPIVYFLFNAMADIWERVFKKPFWIRRFIVPFIIVYVIASVVQFILTALF